LPRLHIYIDNCRNRDYFNWPTMQSDQMPSTRDVSLLCWHFLHEAIGTQKSSLHRLRVRCANYAEYGADSVGNICENARTIASPVDSTLFKHTSSLGYKHWQRASKLNQTDCAFAHVNDVDADRRSTSFRFHLKPKPPSCSENLHCSFVFLEALRTASSGC